MKTQNKTTPAKLSKELYKLSQKMEKLGLKMEYYGGFGEIGKHGRELVGASVIARGWADEINLK